MADFSLLNPTPNFAASALSGYQAGAAIGKQRQLDTAMAGIDLNRPETLLPVLRADPSTGAALIGASVKLHAEDRAQQANDAIANAIDGLGSAPSASTSANPAPAPTAPAVTASATPANPLASSPTSDGSQPGDIVVQAHPAVAQLAAVQSMSPPLQSTMGKLARLGVPLDSLISFHKLATSMTDDQAKAATDRQEAISGVLTSLPKNLSLSDRSAWLTQHKDYLLSHNIPEAEIDKVIADPSDANINFHQTLALGTKDALNLSRQAAAQAETARHNQVDEGQGAARIGLEGQSVGISAGHLALDRQTAARTAAGGGSQGGQIGGPVVQTRMLPGGVHAYRNPANGKWYDNAAFK